MKFTCAILLLLFINNSFSQAKNEFASHGTLIFAIICKDGILLAADSRGSWYGNDSTGQFVFYAHLDSAKKIFKLGNFYVGIGGRNSYKKYFYEDIIENFNKQDIPDSSVTNTFDRFKKYMNSSYNMSDSSIFLTTFYVIGYEKGVPTLLKKDSDTGVLISHQLCLMATTPVNKYLHLDTPYTCSRMFIKTQSLYSNIAKDEIEIGGPTNIIQLNPDNSLIELESFHFLRYKDERQLIQSILQDKAPVVYHYQWSKKYLFTLLEQCLRGENPFCKLD